MNKNLVASSIAKIRELQVLIDTLNGTTIVSITTDISDIKNMLNDIEQDLINIKNTKTTLQKVKQYTRLVESLK